MMENFLDMPNPWIWYVSVESALESIIRKLKKVARDKRKRRLEKIQQAIAFFAHYVRAEGDEVEKLSSNMELVIEAVICITEGLDQLLVDCLDILPACKCFEDCVVDILDFARSSVDSEDFAEVIVKLYSFYLDFAVANPESWTYSLVAARPMEVIIDVIMQRNDQVLSERFADKMLSIANKISSCGDYHCQHSLMVLLLSWLSVVPQHLKSRFLEECFTDMDLILRQSLFKNFKKYDCDYKSRFFIKALNDSAFSPVLVDSFACLFFFVGNTQVFPAMHNLIKDFWVDFSRISKRIHSFCSFSDHLDGCDWFSLSIHNSQIESLCFSWALNENGDSQNQASFALTQTIPEQSSTSGRDFACFVHIILKETFAEICGLQNLNIDGKSIYLVFNNPSGVCDALEMLRVNRHQCGGESCNLPHSLAAQLQHKENISCISFYDQFCSRLINLPRVNSSEDEVSEDEGKTSKTCAKCEKSVYPLEELKCLDKVWHKNCFRCHECAMVLSMKTYKGFNKLPYCEAHIPKAKATTVAETPELRRIQENTKNQSNAVYHADFEKSKGKFTPVVDDPELLRIRQNSKIISNAAYHGDLERKAMMEQKRTLSEAGDQNSNGIAAPRSPSYMDELSSVPVPQPPPQTHQQQRYGPPPTSNSSYRPNSYNSGDNGQNSRQRQNVLASPGPPQTNSSVGGNPSPYSNRGAPNVVYSSEGPVNSNASRKVGSIADYDPVNNYYGSLDPQLGGQLQHKENISCISFYDQFCSRLINLPRVNASEDEVSEDEGKRGAVHDVTNSTTPEDEVQFAIGSNQNKFFKTTTKNRGLNTKTKNKVPEIRRDVVPKVIGRIPCYRRENVPLEPANDVDPYDIESAFGGGDVAKPTKRRRKRTRQLLRRCLHLI